MSGRATDDVVLRQLASILAEGDGVARAVDPPADWRDLLRVADAAALAPALWSAARRGGLLEPVPPHLLPHLQAGERAHPAAILQAAHELNARRSDDLRDQLTTVVAALADAGVAPVVALKGTAMVLAGVWPDPADRQMNDIDLLVPDAGAPTARAALLALGYTEARAVSPSLHHLPALRRDDRHGSFELHVRPVTNAWRPVLTAEEVASTATTASVGRVAVGVPSVDVLATHALAHAYLTDSALSRRTIPLRTTFEVWRLDRTLGPVDWPVVRSRLRRVSRERVVDQHLRTSALLLDGERDPAAERALAPALALLRRPALRRARDVAWRLGHALDGDRLREHYGDERGPVALRAHHLRNLLTRG